MLQTNGVGYLLKTDAHAYIVNEDSEAPTHGIGQSAGAKVGGFCISPRKGIFQTGGYAKTPSHT
jgi:hypothetical protein